MTTKQLPGTLPTEEREPLYQKTPTIANQCLEASMPDSGLSLTSRRKDNKCPPPLGGKDPIQHLHPPLMQTHSRGLFHDLSSISKSKIDGLS